MLNNISKKNLYTTLLMISLPVFFGELFQILYGFINSIWVSKIMGESYLDVLAILQPIILVALGVVSAITSAVALKLGNYIGENNDDKVNILIKSSYRMTFYICLILGIVVALLSYIFINLLNIDSNLAKQAFGYMFVFILGLPICFLIALISKFYQSIGKTKVLLIVSVFGNVLNALFVPILINGNSFLPRLGLSGAALSTLISQLIILVVLYYYTYRTNNRFCFSFKIEKDTTNKEIYSISKLGLPLVGVEFIYAFMYFIIIAILEKSGYVTEYYIFTNVDTFLSLIPEVILITLPIILCQLNGANMKDEMVVFSKNVLVYLIILYIFIIAIPVIVFSQNIVGMYTDNKSLIEDVSFLISISQICQVFYLISIVISSYLESLGDTKKLFIANFMGVLMLRPICIFLFTLSYGVVGIFLASLCSNFVKMSILILYYYNKRHTEKPYELGTIIE
ncbi:MAG TPA: hypothetical protein DCP90_06265 [Clostridiales bacterium]|nr:hypothetical protein [Clostridiales bacterium]